LLHHTGHPGCRTTHAVESGVNVLILSDRGACREMVPIPALLAVSAVHHHLIREGVRTQCSIVVETGEAREIAHFALLLGYGASAINPYLAFETLDDMVQDGAYVVDGLTQEKAEANFFKAVSKGLLKIFAKMGISTLQSYQGAQLFEAIGLSRELVETWFEGTPSRIDGVTLDVLARETQMRHDLAFPEVDLGLYELEPGGLYQWRRRGEHHAFHPDVVAKLQHAVRSETYANYQHFSDLVNDQAERLCTLRGLLKFRFLDQPLSLDEVEPPSAIVKRFCTGAMSFGSISKEAHETLAVAMNAFGGRSNTGEGGEDPERFTPDPDGTLRRSAIKQVASGRFGVTSWYLTNADEIQIKIAQGAKPGEGGQLPGHKVNTEIARIRHSTPGVGLISPPPHHDIYSIEDLAQLIYDLKNANDEADISVKLVSETGVGTVAAGVSKGKADGVVISGHDGGTGASPLTSLKYAGVPWEIGLAETQQTLVLNNLRGRIRVQVDGGLKTGRDVVIGALLGADEFGFSTAPLVAMGCILMRVCHLNTCPVGIATQDPDLRMKFNGLPEHVIRYFFFVAEEIRELMAKLGFRTMDEMIGRVDKLDPYHALDHWKAKGVSLGELLHLPDVPHAIRGSVRQEHGLEQALDHLLIEKAQPALKDGTPVAFEMPLRNVHRTVGTMLGAQVSRRYGEEGLPDDTIQITFKGTAGQSFGAFIPKGMSLTIEGDANDYVGKGLSGGRIVVRVPREATFDPSTSIIAGNVLLYGATGGEAYLGGVVGERFCVRNSGAWAVAEGVGDHGCEYMTGGRVVILGQTGRNFAAGMSGGVAYVLDEDGTFGERCNMGMVALEPLDAEDLALVRTLVERHHVYTDSARAAGVLAHWERSVERFVKVMPIDYKRVLREQRHRAA
ncbi:MAG: glutamate synthase large subunit, partial [Myxococcota bacterium]